MKIKLHKLSKKSVDFAFVHSLPLSIYEAEKNRVLKFINLMYCIDDFDITHCFHLLILQTGYIQTNIKKPNDQHTVQTQESLRGARFSGLCSIY